MQIFHPILKHLKTLSQSQIAKNLENLDSSQDLVS